MIYEHSSYKSFLRDLLAERIQTHPSYSMRRFAMQIGLSVSQLSETLAGRANISVKAGRRVAQLLRLPEDHAEFFCLLVQLETEKREELRARLIKRMDQLRPVSMPSIDLTADVFRQIADWHYYAILELARLPGLTAEACAQRLSISKLEAQVAIDRLDRLGLIEPSGTTWKRSEDPILFKSPGKNTALKILYRQMFEKISAALDEQELYKERLGGFETRCFSKEALPEVSGAMERFFGEVTRISKKYRNAVDVYHFGIHCISLTHSQERKEKK